MSKQQRAKNRERNLRPAPPDSLSERTSLFPFFSSSVQNPNIGVYLACIYVAIMLFIGLLYHNVGDYNVETDFFWSYVPEAKSVLHGIFTIDGFRGPLYPMILACAGALLSDFFRAGILVSVLSAAGVLFFVYGILRKLFRPDAALIGTLLIAVNQTFIQYSYTACTDMFFNLLVTSSLFFLLKNEQYNKRDLIIASVLAACAYLTRYNGVFILLAVPVVLLFVNPFNLAKYERLKTTGIFLAIFFGMITPWAIYCFIKTGSFFYNLNYLNIAYEMFAKGKMGWDQYWNVDSKNFNSLAQVIFADPVLFIKTVIVNIYSHFTSDIELLLLWPLGIISAGGIIIFWKEKPSRRQLALLIFGASFFTVLLIVFYGERFSMFLLLIYIALAVRALTWQNLSSFRFWNRVQIGALISWVLVVWTFSQAYEFNRTNINSGPQEIPIIAEWFKKNVTAPAADHQIISARKPHIAYYIGMDWIPFPYVQSAEELHSQLQAAKAQYLYFGIMEAYMRPQFRDLLEPQKAPAWLTPITYTISPPAVLYKVNSGATR
jgi:4-amino-4-deoxy-L-arabinose transferase-like glycosyltransferase